MRSAVLLDPRRFRLDSIAPPAPGEGEILLKVARSR